MSELSVINFLSLDGVMQSVLSADEDTEGGFDRGGWVSPFVDPTIATFMSGHTTRAGSLLLGRKTYEHFAATWPNADPKDPAVAAMNRIPKYVASRTMTSGSWVNTTVLGPDIASEVTGLKSQPGGDMVVFGSGRLVQSLIEHDLVDSYRLLVFPLVIGKGKRMFPDGGAPARLKLVETETSSTGVVIATYRRAANA